jgi:hypothetical protein
MTCFTLLLLELVFTHVPSKALLGFGGTGLACAGAASPTARADIVARPRTRANCLVTFMTV